MSDLHLKSIRCKNIDSVITQKMEWCGRKRSHTSVAVTTMKIEAKLFKVSGLKGSERRRNQNE